MFSLMGNCCSCIKGRNSEPRKAISVAVLGVDGAGKTTATKALVGESLEVTPTIGFNSEHLKLKNFDITFFDLGGGKKIRDIWQQYLHEVYGVIYMVDSTGIDRFEEVKDNLETLLSHPLVTGKPLLIFANKNDMQDAMETIDVCEQLNIETTVNDNKCPCRIEACSAIKGTGKKIDRTIKEGLLWLVGMIEHNWDMYKKRVDHDVEEYKTKEAEEKEARRERVRKKREERERQEEEERKRLGIEKDDEEEDMIDGNPFKPLSIADLEKKEKKAKEEKARRKELEARLKENEMKSMMEEKKKDNDDDSDDLTIPRSNRSLTRRMNLFDDDFKANKTTNSNPHDDDDDDADSDIIISARSRRSTSRLPPLQQPIGTKFMEETTGKKKKSKKNKKLKALTEVDNEPMQLDDYSYVSREKSVGSLSKIEVERVNSAMNNEYSNSDDNDSDYLDNKILRNESLKRSSQRSNYSFDNPNYNDYNTHNSSLGNVENVNSEEEVKDLYAEINKSNSQKKSKKKSKKNRKQSEDSADFSGSATRKEESDEDIFRVPRRHLPSLDGGQDIDTTAVRKLKVKKKNFLKKNKTLPSDDDDISVPDIQGNRDFSWTVSPKRESNISRSNPYWGFAEDLEKDDDSDYGNSQLKSKPNMDDDDDIMY